MKRRSWKPSAELAAHIERYWTWESGPGEPLPTLLPGTGHDVYFHAGAPFGAAAGRAHLVCVRTRPWALEAAGRVAFTAIRFRMGALRHFCRVGAEELFDQSVAVEDLWGREGGRWAGRIVEAEDARERLELLNGQLARWLRIHRRGDDWVDAAAGRVYRGHAACRIEAVAAEMGVGRRRMERGFRAALGMSPKEFHRLARFQQTVRELLLAKSAAGLDAALAHGYYDQPHFIREFEAYAKVAPGAFLTPRNFASHFYNPPESVSGIRS